MSFKSFLLNDQNVDAWYLWIFQVMGNKTGIL